MARFTLFPMAHNVQKETQADLLSEIEDFCRKTNIAESTFGKKAVNDGKFVNRLRSGKSTTLATAAYD